MHPRLARELPPREVEWAVGAVLGMVVGDAFGAAVHGSPAVPVGPATAPPPRARHVWDSGSWNATSLLLFFLPFPQMKKGTKQKESPGRWASSSDARAGIGSTWCIIQA